MTADVELGKVLLMLYGMAEHDFDKKKALKVAAAVISPMYGHEVPPAQELIDRYDAEALRPIWW